MKKDLNEFRKQLRVELARAGLTQRALADRLRVADTTLSDWVRGAHPAPPEFHSRIEKALGLAPGTFTDSE